MDSHTVLVVVDDPDMRLYVRGCLGSLWPKVGRVLESADGIEALSLVRSGVVDAVIADVGSPGLDGAEICRAIKEDPGLRRLSVLLIGGEEGLLPARIGADGHLAKPFNAHGLRAALEGVLDRETEPPPRGDGLDPGP